MTLWATRKVTSATAEAANEVFDAVAPRPDDRADCDGDREIECAELGECTPLPREGLAVDVDRPGGLTVVCGRKISNTVDAGR